jgi:intergrase/recombinase
MAAPIIPDLPHGCGSWIIVRKGTLDSVAEFFDRATVERVNGERYDALTALDYLGRLNRQIRDAGA